MEITEDYVSLEIAELLKEKGFYESCRVSSVATSLPTLQMAMKWLRIKHEILIEIIGFSLYNGKTKNFEIRYKSRLYGIKRTTPNYMEEIILHDTVPFQSYEDAALEGIKYCLTNLIK